MIEYVVLQDLENGPKVDCTKIQIIFCSLLVTDFCHDVRGNAEFSASLSLLNLTTKFSLEKQHTSLTSSLSG